jgi:hypothetical protein
MKTQTFEEYLQDIHAENYMGTGDDMPDKFDSWISEMDVNEVIELAEKYGTNQWDAGFRKAKDIAMDAITYKPITN